MTHVVTEACIGCKYRDCIYVCPVSCFYELDDMMIIDPESCIDCGVCIPECPVEAIKEGSESLIDWIEHAKNSIKVSKKAL